jgi:ammonia channel protein AmtB
MKPGGTPATGTVKITNTGSLAGIYSLSSTDSPSGAATVCGHMDLTVTDEASNTIYSGTIDGLVAASPKALTVDNPFAASTGNHTFTFSVWLDLTTSTNSDQGQTCTATFTWTATPA